MIDRVEAFSAALKFGAVYHPQVPLRPWVSWQVLGPEGGKPPEAKKILPRHGEVPVRRSGDAINGGLVDQNGLGGKDKHNQARRRETRERE